LSSTAEGICVWNLWWNVCNFPSTLVKCESIVSQGIKRKWNDICIDSVKYCSISDWCKEVNTLNAKVGKGSNKLRTYALYKNTWGYEKYLDFIDNRDKRILLTKFRMGITPLRIETGRYESNNGNKGIQAELRFCLCCKTERVEDEYHFLMVCPVYTNLRNLLLLKVKGILVETVNNNKVSEKTVQSIMNDDRELFIFIMKSENKEIILSLSSYIWKAFKCREMMLVV